MANPQRGEISAVLDGEERVLCLTLGALAELEARLGAGDLTGLGERFAAGRVSARDLTAIIGAGLRGAGHQFTDDAVARMRAEGGAAGFVDIVSRLLTATFGMAEDAPMAKAVDTSEATVSESGSATGPFPGAT